MTHTVKSQETLFSIAKRYGVSVIEIKKTNGLNSDNLRIGQILTIPLPIPANSPTPTQIPVQNMTVFDRRKLIIVKKDIKPTFSNISITFPLPNGEMAITGLMRDNVQSVVTLNPKGVSYQGKSDYASHQSLFEDLCNPPFYVNVLKYVASSEGFFDAVNSYDKAIFSFGFIQFTGSLATGSILTKVLKRLKVRDEYAFREAFWKYGINIQDVGSNSLVTLEMPNGQVTGDDAFRAIANDLQLTGVFIASGFRKSMIRAQIEIALEEYVFKALSPNVTLTINNQKVVLNQLIFSEGGFALRVELCINQGLGGSLIALKKAIEQAISEDNLSDFSRINERRVVEILSANESQAFRKQRILKILNSNFNFQK
jgi:murein DD-endopeptidase MepM/ murein hydrolase activator NlpD